MNRTRRLITEQLPRLDIVIEIIDARIPASSRNPLLEEICSSKPQLLVLNKADLADPEVTEKWLDYLKAEKLNAVAVNSTIPSSLSGILKTCRRTVEETTGKPGAKINALTAGIPNVGKSTIVNGLRGRRKASVQNKPGHTVDFQRIVVSNTLTLIDTPGILWHKFEPETGYRLAAMGSIKDSILDMYDITSAALMMTAERYPEKVMDRFRIDELPETPDRMIELIGRKRGFLMKGGIVDIDRACSIIIQEIRGGKLGPMSFELPPER